MATKEPKYLVDESGYAYGFTETLAREPGFKAYDGPVDEEGYAPKLKKQAVADLPGATLEDLPAVRLTARHEDVSVSNPAMAPDSTDSGVLSGGVNGVGNISGVDAEDVKKVTTGVGHTDADYIKIAGVELDVPEAPAPTDVPKDAVEGKPAKPTKPTKA